MSEGAAEERTLSADAVTPRKVRVMKTAGEGVAVEWKDGHQSQWSFAWLRRACPCATCVEERAGAGRRPGEAAPKSPLALYEPPALPLEVTPVGNYAVQFKWNDGHESGIYSWEYLRGQCQCAACLEPLR
jgi:DUF971 family protein